VSLLICLKAQSQNHPKKSKMKFNASSHLLKKIGIVVQAKKLLVTLGEDVRMAKKNVKKTKRNTETNKSALQEKKSFVPQRKINAMMMMIRSTAGIKKISDM